MMNRKGFTLVELMIVVAIIGILASIAIPNFVDMQYRAKRAEVPSNVDGIKTAQLAYDASYDSYIDAGSSSQYPDSTPGKAQRAWTTGTPFDTLGWSPDGNVRGSYMTYTGGPTSFKVLGYSDVDGDGNNAMYHVKHDADNSVNATMGTGNNVY
jgi:prepilin-type N-terminal cleavage/methylation domain-containing protein